MALNNEGQLRHVQSKAILADEELEKIQKNMTIERNDLVVLSAGPEKPACNVLGKYAIGMRNCVENYLVGSVLVSCFRTCKN